MKMKLELDYESYDVLTYAKLLFKQKQLEISVFVLDAREYPILDREIYSVFLNQIAFYTFSDIRVIGLGLYQILSRFY